MNSFTGIFQQYFKPPHRPHVLTHAPPPPHQILKSPPTPMLSTPVGNPESGHFLVLLYPNQEAKSIFFKNLKKSQGKLNLCLCTKYHSYLMFCWEATGQGFSYSFKFHSKRSFPNSTTSQIMFPRYLIKHQNIKIDIETKF